MQPQAQAAQRQADALHQAVAGLAGNHSFRLFLDEVRRQKGDAIAGACGYAREGNVTASQAALGAVAAYQDILDCYAEHTGDTQVLD